MSPLLRIPVSLTALVLAACTSVTGEQPSALGNAVDVEMLEYMNEHNIPGATVAVTKNGRLVFWKGYGWADVEAKVPMQPWHRTRIGSVSKLLTAIGVLQLVENGTLSLEDPLYASTISVAWTDDGQPFIVSSGDGVLADAGMSISALAEAPPRLAANPPSPPEDLPDYPYPPDYMKQGGYQPFYQKHVETLLQWASQIQVQHLLTHTAGLLRSGDVPKTQTYWQEKGELLPGELPSYPQIHAAMLAGVNGYPLLFPAGSFWKYSNHGYGVLGQIIADQSGMSYAQYMQQHVFAPLGLTEIVPANVLDDKDAVSYKEDDNGNWVPIPTNEMTKPVLGLATGGWAANAGDLVRILCAIGQISDNRRLLSPEMAYQMFIPRFPMASQNTLMGWDGYSPTEMFYTKNGDTPKRGGSARVSHFRPDTSVSVVDSEIQVAVAFNITSVYDKEGKLLKSKVPSNKLLTTIAKLIDKTSIAPSFDLFPPQSRCRWSPALSTETSPPTREG